MSSSETNGKNTELGIQRLECVHSIPSINCVESQVWAKNGTGLGTCRSKTSMALGRLIALGRVLSILLKVKVYGENSLCYSKLDSAWIVVKQ